MKFKGWVETNKIGSRCEFVFEVEDEDLEGLTDSQRLELIQEVGNDALWDSGQVSWGWGDPEDAA